MSPIGIKMFLQRRQIAFFAKENNSRGLSGVFNLIRDLHGELFHKVEHRQGRFEPRLGDRLDPKHSNPLGCRLNLQQGGHQEPQQGAPPEPRPLPSVVLIPPKHWQESHISSNEVQQLDLGDTGNKKTCQKTFEKTCKNIQSDSSSTSITRSIFNGRSGRKVQSFKESSLRSKVIGNAGLTNGRSRRKVKPFEESPSLRSKIIGITGLSEGWCGRIVEIKPIRLNVFKKTRVKDGWTFVASDGNESFLLTFLKLHCKGDVFGLVESNVHNGDSIEVRFGNLGVTGPNLNVGTMFVHDIIIPPEGDTLVEDDTDNMKNA